MEKKALNVIRLAIFLSAIFYGDFLFGQENNTPKIVNEERFIRTVSGPPIFSGDYRGNLDSIKYEGYYAILKIKEGRVMEIVYSNHVKQIEKRHEELAINRINEKIDNGMFKLVNIDQVIIPVIREWVQFKTDESNLDLVLKRVIPKTGYTPNTYTLNPIIIKTGNPIRN
jgi:hypothetical protein